MCERIAAVSRQTDPTFTYVYWNEPDATMHEDGCYVQSTKTVLTDIDRQLALMAERLPADTLLLITPDHGMIDVEEAKLGNYPDLNECFYRAATMEPRCNSFYVKEDKKVIFEQLFAEYFPDFLLLTRDEAFNNQLFGSGEVHPELPGMLGNYFGMAIGSRIIAHDSDHHFNFKAHHAGLTADEMIIPLIAYYR
ncbi:hypothetical protein SDC9_191727 [bioreactor metagenome]|uniref:Uncharacterized protein n=1 Tax=bioreactor metagenome TaxID=1076179 RepID=A0A645HZZ3_9ZZZZ